MYVQLHTHNIYIYIYIYYMGVSINGGTPLSLDGLVHGKSQSQMDDWGYPYDSGNLHWTPPAASSTAGMGHLARPRRCRIPGH